MRYEPTTGEFTWIVKRKRVPTTGATPPPTAGSAYRRIGIDGVIYKAHRLAFLYMTGEWPTGQVDHKDGDGSNNRWENLRDVTAAVNAQNKRRAQANSATGLLGVSFDKWSGRFAARIDVGGKGVNLGRFDDPKAAHEAYIAAKREFHEGATI
jgi:hypothetical protein